MAQRDDAFVWTDGHYRVRRFFAADVVWIVLLVAVTVAVVVAAVLAYGARNDKSTTIDHGSAPAAVVRTEVAA